MIYGCGWFIVQICSPTSDGSAAVILASEDFVRQHNLQSQAVEIVGMEMGTDTPSTFGRSSMSLVSVKALEKLAFSKPVLSKK